MSARTIHPRQKILNAALKLFVEKGFFNTNIPSICKASGCPVGSIYHYFKNKEEIAIRIYEESLFQLLEQMRSEVQEADTFREQIGVAIRHLVDFTENWPHKARYLLLARHNEFIGKRIPTLITAFIQELGEFSLMRLQQGISTGQIKPLPLEVAVVSLTAIPLRYCQSWLDGDFETAPSEVAEQLIECAWDAVKQH